MSVLFAIVVFVLVVPVLLVVGIALGPAILVILFVIGCTLPVLWVHRAWSRHRRGGASPRHS